MMTKIRKAIIPAAGLGTRFLPATKAMPKEMLPVVDKPTIQYIVEEAVASGIEDIIIVTGRNKRPIEDHFDKNVELELNLREKHKDELLQMVESIDSLADIHYVRQKNALGLGHAVWCARKFIGNEPFAVLLGDMIIDSVRPCLKQLIDVYDERQSSVVAVEPVDWAEVNQYGIVEGIETADGLIAVKNMIEKPLNRPASNLAMIGRYVLEPEIFTILEKTQPGVGGEIQLTDALQHLCAQGRLMAYRYQGQLYDIGNKLGFLKANVQLAYQHEDLREEFDRFIRAFLQSEEL
jgi:UTP--glucose-1-phosphate uridylyltransferase